MLILEECAEFVGGEHPVELDKVEVLISIGKKWSCKNDRLRVAIEEGEQMVVVEFPAWLLCLLIWILFEVWFLVKEALDFTLLDLACHGSEQHCRYLLVETV